MNLRYSVLRQKPAIFKTMTGLTVPLFDELVWDLESAYAEAYAGYWGHPLAQARQ